MQALRLKSLDAREAFSKQVVQGRTDKGTQEKIEESMEQQQQIQRKEPVASAHHTPLPIPLTLFAFPSHDVGRGVLEVHMCSEAQKA